MKKSYTGIFYVSVSNMYSKNEIVNTSPYKIKVSLI